MSAVRLSQDHDQQSISRYVVQHWPAAPAGLATVTIMRGARNANSVYSLRILHVTYCLVYGTRTGINKIRYSSRRYPSPVGSVVVVDRK